MSKYRKTLDRRDAFTPQEADAAIFTPENVDELAVSDRTIVRSIPIADISPDPGQPRRIVPSAVLSISGRTAIPYIFDTWAMMAFEETGGVKVDAPFAHRMYRAMIEGTLEEDGWQLPEKPGYIEASIMAVAELAANIRQVGLTYPITVAPAPEGLVDSEYIIETGERRFWAYRMLNFYYGPDWLKIPAKVQDALDIWRQAAENNQRSDLNAIGKARQLAILLMDLLQTEEYEKARKEDRAAVRLFAPMTGFNREQEYYAQVADAAKWRVPYGKIEQLLPAMGVKTSGTLSQYRGFLRLPPEVWIEADDRGYSRDSLLQIVYAVNNLDDERVDFTKSNGGGISQKPPALPSKPSPPAPLPQGEGSKNAGAATGEGGNIPNGVSQPGKPSAQESVVGVGKWVYVKDGRIGLVKRWISNSLVEVQIEGRFGPYPPDSLRPAPLFVGMYVKSGAQICRITAINGSEIEAALGEHRFTTTQKELMPTNWKPSAPAVAKDISNSNPFSVGDRVVLGDSADRLTWRAGVIRYIKDEQCGVFFDRSQSTHYYDWSKLVRESDIPVEVSAPESTSHQPDVDTTSHTDWEYDKPDGQQSAMVETATGLTLAEIRFAVERMIGSEHDEGDLDVMRRFFIERSHDLGVLTPWDSEVAITTWLAEDLVNNGEVGEGLTLVRVEAAQLVLGQARRWLER